MNIIMNKVMKKRLMSCLDAHMFSRVTIPANTYVNRNGGTYTYGNGAFKSTDAIKETTQNVEFNSFRRKFAKYKISYLSDGVVIYTKTYSTKQANMNLFYTSYKLPSWSGGDYAHMLLVAKYNVTPTSSEGVIDSGFSITGTDDGGVQLSLIKPYDFKPTQTGVNIDSFQIEFFDDFDRPTAIVTGTIGDLNSTADVKMANTLIEDGAYINISGMDDFLITTPNTIAISN